MENSENTLNDKMTALERLAASMNPTKDNPRILDLGPILTDVTYDSSFRQLTQADDLQLLDVVAYNQDPTKGPVSIQPPPVILGPDVSRTEFPIVYGRGIPGQVVQLFSTSSPRMWFEVENNAYVMKTDHQGPPMLLGDAIVGPDGKFEIQMQVGINRGWSVEVRTRHVDRDGKKSHASKPHTIFFPLPENKDDEKNLLKDNGVYVINDEHIARARELERKRVNSKLFDKEHIMVAPITYEVNERRATPIAPVVERPDDVRFPPVVERPDDIYITPSKPLDLHDQMKVSEKPSGLSELLKKLGADKSSSFSEILKTIRPEEHPAADSPFHRISDEKRREVEDILSGKSQEKFEKWQKGRRDAGLTATPVEYEHEKLREKVYGPEIRMESGGRAPTEEKITLESSLKKPPVAKSSHLGGGRGR